MRLVVIRTTKSMRRATNRDLRPGDMVRVEVVDAMDYDLVAEVEIPT